MNEILCDVCKFPIDGAMMFHSKTTDHYYCGDIDECHRRARNDLTMNEIMWLAQEGLKIVEQLP